MFIQEPINRVILIKFECLGNFLITDVVFYIH